MNYWLWVRKSGLHFGVNLWGFLPPWGIQTDEILCTKYPHIHHQNSICSSSYLSLQPSLKHGWFTREFTNHTWTPQFAWTFYLSLLFKRKSQESSYEPKVSADVLELAREPTSGKEKGPKINKFGGLSWDWVGGKIVFVYVVFWGHSFGGEKPHKLKSPRNPGTVLWKFALCVFSGLGKRGLLKKTAFRKVHLIDILENLEILEMLENPETVENKGESDHLLEII